MNQSSDKGFNFRQRIGTNFRSTVEQLGGFGYTNLIAMISMLNHIVHVLRHVAGNIRPARTPTITLALVTLVFLVSFFGQAA
eukprot:49441-Rhodomonas_salina.1